MNFITSVLRPIIGCITMAYLFKVQERDRLLCCFPATNVESNRKFEMQQMWLQPRSNSSWKSLRHRFRILRRIPQTVHFYWTMSSLFSRLRRNICQQRYLKSTALMVGHLFHLLHGIDTVKEVASEEGKWKRVNASRHPHVRGKIEFVSGAFDIRGTE